MFFKKINCKYYIARMCKYIPKYLDKSMKIEKICEYTLLKKEDRKPLIKKCPMRKTINILNKNDRKAGKQKAREKRKYSIAFNKMHKLETKVK